MHSFPTRELLFQLCSGASRLLGALFFSFFLLVFTRIFISGEPGMQVDYVRQTGFKGVKERIPIRSAPLISFKTAVLQHNPKLVTTDDVLEVCTLYFITNETPE